MKRKYFIILGIMAIPAMLLLIFIYKSNPATGPIIPCLFQTVTGLHCPGCGMTRAVNALMHFDFFAAVGYNVLPFVLFPFMLLFFIYRKDSKKREPIAIAMVVVSLVFMVLRNLEKFRFLAPV